MPHNSGLNARNISIPYEVDVQMSQVNFYSLLKQICLWSTFKWIIVSVSTGITNVFAKKLNIYLLFFIWSLTML